MTAIHGTVAPGFEPVRDAFARGFAELGETGASFYAIHRGAVVADLWGGEAFARDSLVHVYSVTKPAAAFCVLVLAGRGRLALDDRVADHWPAFAAAGKDTVTIRQLLSHQAGLVALREPLPAEALLDHDRIAAALAAEAPWWELGSATASTRCSTGTSAASWSGAWTAARSGASGARRSRGRGGWTSRSDSTQPSASGRST